MDGPNCSTIWRCVFHPRPEWPVCYPQVRTLYIGELFLHPSVQGRGLGREVCLRLEELCRKASLRRIRVGVALRNWNALRFWIKLGFLDVTGMSGDRVFAPDAYAFLELQRKL